jgi:glycosyltransferase involved in cell wall biosynthesis
MKILHIAPFFHGGVGIVALNLTKEFGKMGHEVILATPTSPPHELKDYITWYYALRKPTLPDPFYAIQFYLYNNEAIKDIVRQEKPDVILTHGPLVIIAKAVHEVPIVSVIHGTYANEVKWMWYHPVFGIERIRYITGIYTSYRFDMALYRYITRLGNVHLLAVSKNTRKELINAGTPPSKVYSVLNGVDKELFRPIKREDARSLVERLFNIKLRGKVLLHVNPGTLKGTHILVKAVAIVKKAYGNDFTLLIVGKLGHKSYRDYVEELVRGLGLMDNVKMLGYVENKLLPLLHNATDITVTPSYSEGAPLVIPESLACGTPVVATDVGGNPEYLALAGIDDLLVRISNYDFSSDLASRILYALEKYTAQYQFNTIPSFSEMATQIYSLLKRIHEIS